MKIQQKNVDVRARVESLPSHEGYTDFRRLTYSMSSLKVVIILTTLKYQSSVLYWCSCRDNSTRGMKCKHIWSIEFAIRFGTLRDTDKLPANAKQDTSTLISPKPSQIAIEAKSYTEDDYSF